MKLLCINNKEIFFNNIIHEGTGLKEGEVYVTRGKAYKNVDNELGYYIDGLGHKLCCRFTELLDERDEAEIAIEKLKEEFQLN